VGTFLRKSNLRWSPSYSWTSLMVGSVDPRIITAVSLDVVSTKLWR
jgi:hypothetical protein